MRLLAGTLLLAGCSSSGMSTATEDNLIDCAPGGVDTFARVCRVERRQEGKVLFLTVRHPDGAFRRFEVLADGRGLAAADGAEPAQVSAFEDGIEVVVGSDRYRFPATIRGADATD